LLSRSAALIARFYCAVGCEGIQSFRSALWGSSGDEFLPFVITEVRTIDRLAYGTL
jgi:hypothetical protein